MRKISLLMLLVLGLASTMALAQSQDEFVARGRYLAEGILGCGNCHTPKGGNGEPNLTMKFAGAFVVEEPGLKAFAPNITMDVETGIGSWTDEEIIVSIRDGLRPDGTLIGPPMPSPFFRGMSDNDVRAVVAYLRTIEPISNVVEKSTYTIPLPPAYGPPVGEVPDVPRADELAYGTYLAVTLGHCIDCHTPFVDGMHDFSRTNEGGRVLPNVFGVNTIVSRNITPHPQLGIGEWTDEEIKRAITEGVSRDGREHLVGMAYSYYATMTDEDLDAIIAYLRSVPPSPPIE
ncbi:MAG TPA: c-type cytochrome [Gammaproteobacteria bacterium]